MIMFKHVINVTILDNEAQNNLEENKNINDQPNYIPTNIFDPGPMENY